MHSFISCAILSNMKAKKSVLILVMLCTAFSLFAKDKLEGKKVYAVDKEVALKEKASVRGKKIGTVLYGSEVIVVQDNEKWVYVKSSDDESVKGWAPAASFRKKKITAMDGTVTANAKEIALAGRGWSEALKESNTKIPATVWASVDDIEARSFTEAEIYVFMQEGQLNVGGEEE